MEIVRGKEGGEGLGREGGGGRCGVWVGGGGEGGGFPCSVINADGAVPIASAEAMGGGGST